VVHRDIKPGNVMVTDDAVKIVDFGLATLAGSVQITQAGSPMGTVAYMAPEQLRGHAATAQSDVWAVGAMLYEMLAGHPPFQGAYAEAISYAIRHETPPPLRDARPTSPKSRAAGVPRAAQGARVRFASGASWPARCVRCRVTRSRSSFRRPPSTCRACTGRGRDRTVPACGRGLRRRRW
jgi:serine/threonine protein kinase